jgi:hypothetical protein
MNQSRKIWKNKSKLTQKISMFVYKPKKGFNLITQGLQKLEKLPKNKLNLRKIPNWFSGF